MGICRGPTIRRRCDTGIFPYIELGVSRIGITMVACFMSNPASHGALPERGFPLFPGILRGSYRLYNKTVLFCWLWGVGHELFQSRHHGPFRCFGEAIVEITNLPLVDRIETPNSRFLHMTMLVSGANVHLTFHFVMRDHLELRSLLTRSSQGQQGLETCVSVEYS